MTGPHPALTPARRRAVELDYGMKKGTLELMVRAASIYYARKRLGLDRMADSVMRLPAFFFSIASLRSRKTTSPGKD